MPPMKRAQIQTKAAIESNWSTVHPYKLRKLLILVYPFGSVDMTFLTCLPRLGFDP